MERTFYRNGHLVHLEESWCTPTESDASILSAPNIAPQMSEMAPRNIIDRLEWQAMRLKCCQKAKYLCELCGKPLMGDECSVHEMYDVDYATGEQKFTRCVCLCEDCHFVGMHSGRALGQYKRKERTADWLLSNVEKIFKMVYDYNSVHDVKIRLYATYLDYLNYEELKYAMEELIDKYELEFWKENNAVGPEWSDWCLLFDGERYPAKYNCFSDLQRIMDARCGRNTSSIRFV